VDLTDVTVLAGVLVVVGVLGTVLPVLPGALLVAGGVLLWAIAAQELTAWLVLLGVLVVLGAGQVLKYVTAGRRMVASGVPRRSLVIAGMAGIVGFVVIPVVGLVVGFVGGLYVAERVRVGGGSWNDPTARRSTVTALQAVGLAILVELASALLAAAAFFVAVARGVGP
jgi:uncharacterized protein